MSQQITYIFFNGQLSKTTIAISELHTPYGNNNPLCQSVVSYIEKIPTRMLLKNSLPT